jgi:hypothetical protein
VLRVLVVVLGGNSIITSRRFLREREVTLMYLGGTSQDTLARTIGPECLIMLLPSWLLMERSVCVELIARALIGC